MALSDNYTYARTMVPSDTVDQAILGNQAMSTVAALVPYFDGIYIGGAGVVALVLVDGSVVNFTCVAGQTLRMRGRRVNSTNTTATLMNALYIY